MFTIKRNVLKSYINTKLTILKGLYDIVDNNTK